MSTDRTEISPNKSPDELDMDLLARRLRRLNSKLRHLTIDDKKTIAEEILRFWIDHPRVATDSSVLTALTVQVSVLEAQVNSAKLTEDRLRGELKTRSASYEAELSASRAELARSKAERARLEADRARLEAENAILRQENKEAEQELRETRLEINEIELENGVLRDRLGLARQPSMLDLN